MMAVLAVLCLVKLIAFVAAGIFVTYGLYHGFGDLYRQIQAAELERLLGSQVTEGSPFVHWITLILLGAASIQCLPRQFHVAVVENSREQEIRQAMWLVPLYLIAISLFVIPIAAAGLLAGLPQGQADEFVLRLPQIAEAPALTLLVFIGGFSAATGMVIISAMTLSTMATNHLLLPVIEGFSIFSPLRHRLLQCRWAMIALILCSGYWFAWEFNDAYQLVAMGMISFVAVFQFVPALFGGLFWRGGNQMGAVAGLLAGFTLWFYTLVVPLFVDHGWLSNLLLIDGPWSIRWLRPEAMLGVEGLSPISHSVLWSLVFNGGGYIFGSLLYRPSKLERTQCAEFMSVLKAGSRIHKGRPTGLEAYINFSRKKREAVELLAEYLNTDKAEAEVDHIARDLQVEQKSDLTIIELVEFHRLLESVLAGSIGAASAHRAMEHRIRYSERETLDLKAIYSHIVAELHSQGGGPGDDDRYTFIETLQRKLDEQGKQLQAHRGEMQRMGEKLDRSDQMLFDQRLLNQKLAEKVRSLRRELEKSARKG